MSEYLTAGVSVDIRQCATARALWDALDRTSETWADSARRWAFRGQGNSSWSLEPSAWRDTGESGELVAAVKRAMLQGGAAINLQGRARNGREWEWFLQRAAESYLMHEFIRAADEAGVRLPEGTPRECQWNLPHSESEVVALAQHYGVPTGVVDLTWNPRVAMFWALEQAQPAVASLAVWALDTRGTTAGIQFPPHPRAGNEHLRFQEGVVACMTTANDFLQEHGRLPALETCGAVRRDALIRFELPPHAFGDLRRMLDAEGIHYARLMPTLYGAARTATRRHVLAISRRSLGL